MAMVSGRHGGKHCLLNLRVDRNWVVGCRSAWLEGRGLHSLQRMAGLVADAWVCDWG